MSKFRLELELSGHDPANPAAQRAFVVQMLHQAAQAVGSAYVDPRVKTGADLVEPDHHSVSHAAGDIVYGARAFDARKIGSWEFTDTDEE